LPTAEIQPTSAPPSTPAPAPTAEIEALTFVTGRNDYVIRIDGDPREFLVYVPAGYDASQPTPVVIMYHGSNQGGPLMFENTKWKEKANAIVIFPTGWKYPLIGETGKHTKWNDFTLVNQVEPGTELKDDIKFTREMLAQIKATFNVDEKRIFATGFSNGGSFVSSRLLFQVNDVFAAYAVCGSGSKFGNEAFTDLVKTRVVTSLYSIIGTEDEKIAEGSGHARPFPIRVDDILADELFGLMLTNTATSLSLDPAIYQADDSKAAYTSFFYNQSMVGSDNEYVFLMINGMGHIYPSGDNNRYGINAADLFWEFFMKHPLK
jgi:poly(3-hydroxybutyrate) depolymerase